MPNKLQAFEFIASDMARGINTEITPVPSLSATIGTDLWCVRAPWGGSSLTQRGQTQPSEDGLREEKCFQGMSWCVTEEIMKAKVSRWNLSLSGNNAVPHHACVSCADHIFSDVDCEELNYLLLCEQKWDVFFPAGGGEWCRGMICDRQSRQVYKAKPVAAVYAV